MHFNFKNEVLFHFIGNQIQLGSIFMTPLHILKEALSGLQSQHTI